MPRTRRTGQLLRRAVREYIDDHCSQLAAAMSYHVLFSVFPLAIAGVGVLGLVTRGQHARDAVVRAAVAVVPLSTSGHQQVQRLVDSISGSAGALGLIGLIGVLWSASGMMAAMRTALNIAWDTDARRSIVRGKLVDLALVAGAIVPLGVAVAVTVVADLVRRGDHQLPGPLATVAGPVIDIAAIVIAVTLIAATFLFLYRLVPAVPTRIAEVWPGAVAGALGLTAAQYGFATYLAHFANYNRVYGSLGAVVAFLFFVYVASAIFLFGAEVASEYPRLPGSSPARARARRGDAAPSTSD